MSNLHNPKNLGTIITFNQEDIPGQLTLDQWDTITDCSGKDRLLVTIGDSWTWGDSLTPALANNGFDVPGFEETHWDYEARKKYCYGAHLSKHLNADWINYGFPGYSNVYILERFAHTLRSSLMEQYDEIYFVLCLTETGREHAWLPVPETVPDMPTDQYAAQLEQWLIDCLYTEYGDRDLSKLIVCRNFTKSFDSTEYHTKHLKPWIQINWEHEPTDQTLDQILVTGPGTQIGIDPLWFLESYEDYLVRHHDNLNGLYSFLEQSRHHSSKATKHPTPESHSLWADYLHQQFQQLSVSY